MAPVIKEGWINLYKSTDINRFGIVTGFVVFDTKAIAICYIHSKKDYIDTVRIEYEQ